MQARAGGEFDIGAHARGHHHQVGGDFAAVLEAHAGDALGTEDLCGLRAQQETQALAFQRALEQRGGGLVELAFHQAVGQVHHGHVHALAQQSVGRFQSEQAAADHHRMAMIARGMQHGLDVLDVAERDHAFELVARHRNDERLGAGGQQQAVIAHFASRGGTHHAAWPVDRYHGITGKQLDAVLFVPLARVEHDVRHRLLAGQHRRQQDAVVVAVRLGAEHRDVVQVRGELEQFLDGAHAGHAVADDDQARTGLGGIGRRHAGISGAGREGGGKHRGRDERDG
ncbi:hypothetical protein D9M70_480840 [compost metagenome]